MCAGRRPARYSHDSITRYALERCGSEESCNGWLNWVHIETRMQLELYWHMVEALAIGYARPVPMAAGRYEKPIGGQP